MQNSRENFCGGGWAEVFALTLICPCLEKSSMTLMVAVGRGFYFEWCWYMEFCIADLDSGSLVGMVWEAELVARNLSFVAGRNCPHLGHSDVFYTSL